MWESMVLVLNKVKISREYYLSRYNLVVAASESYASNPGVLLVIFVMIS